MTPPQPSSAASAVAPARQSPHPPHSVLAGAEPAVVAEMKRRLQGGSAASFDLHLPDHRVYRVGSGPASFALRLRTPAALAALASFDEFAVASAYMNGEIDVEGDFLAALDLRKAMTDWHPLHSLWRHLRPMLFGQVNSDKLWVQQHYDYGNDFYFAFLDKRARLYSQALYRSDEQSLEDAAEQKLEYVFRTCRLAPGSHVLDIGAGWGSFAGYASRRGVNVTMLTISKEQYEYQRSLVAAQASPGTLETVFESVFAYQSPRKYDAIVLLGVMEHLPDYQRLFAVFERLLKPGGRLYMDFASNRKKFNVSSFTYRYIFPGSHTPVVIPDLLAAANRTAFEPVAMHNDRHSYFLTLQAWGRNLEAQRAALVPKYGERTFRLFQLYLWGCARQFQRDGELESYRIVFQKGHGAPSAEIGLKH
jgi:cyclopropane-fatty-acyl-phospholipid synthase